MPFQAFLVAITLFSTPADIGSSRPGIDVERYRFEIAVSDSTNEIHGRAEVTVRFTKGIDSFFLDLVGRMDGAAGMTVTAVRLDEKGVSFEHAHNRLTIDTGVVSEGDRRTYTVSYHGTPGEGLIISMNKFGERTFFGENWPD